MQEELQNEAVTYAKLSKWNIRDEELYRRMSIFNYRRRLWMMANHYGDKTE